MGNRYLLDCTLRDGGYVNDWEFGYDNIVNIFDRLISSKVDIIEIGFLDERRFFDINRSIMPDTKSVSKIFGKLNHRDTLVVGMIDYGTVNLKNLQPCSESWLDGIRVIFKKDNMYPAMEYCRQVKLLGYKVFCQLVSVTSYTDEELVEVVRLANSFDPFAVSMVDTYGLMNPNELNHIMSILDKNLDPKIAIGFHAHNNFQLGYVNATTALDFDTNRDVLVDGTLYGMGKSAGNAPLELIAMYMNEHCSKNYVISEMQEAITTSVLDFQKKSPWGYQLFYYIAASNKVHPNYVSYLMNKRTLSITAINEILQRIPDDQKLEKNMRLIEHLYIEYQKIECSDEVDIERLSLELSGRQVLMVGPGATVKTHENDIKSFIKDNPCVVISVNYIPLSFSPSFVFITNTTRYIQIASKLYDCEDSHISMIATSNLTKNDRAFDYLINYSSVIDESTEFPDNSMCMLIRTLIRCGCSNVCLAGFDGYTADNVNYYDIDKAYSFLREKADSLNEYGKRFFASVAENITIRFITPSEYQKG